MTINERQNANSCNNDEDKNREKNLIRAFVIVQMSRTQQSVRVLTAPSLLPFKLLNVLP